MFAQVSLAASTPKFPEWVIQDEVLIGLRGDHNDAATAAAAASSLGKVIRSVPRLRTYVIKLRPGVTLMDALVTLSRNRNVVSVEPNLIVRAAGTPNDPQFVSQYGLKITKTDLAWTIWTPVQPVRIAVLDSGVDVSHPDLINKIATTPGGAFLGYSALSGSAFTDSAGHGTHCAGIAAAQINNSTGIAGVAGWNTDPASSDTQFVKLLPVKVLGADGHGTVADLIQGIDWASSNGSTIESMSLAFREHYWPFGYPPWEQTPPSVDRAIYDAWQKGIMLVAAADNDGSSDPVQPASQHGVIAVGATDSSDTMTDFSNWGTWVDVLAPGNVILSTLPGGLYGDKSGTSMACPHVAGEAALMSSQNPRINDEYVSYLIRTEVDPYHPYGGRSIAAAGGRINVFEALQKAGKPDMSVSVAPNPFTVGTFPIPLGRVVLDNPAPADGTITLRSLDPQDVTVPAVLHIAAGQTVAMFIPAVHSAPGYYKATIVAEHGAGVATATMRIYPNPMAVLNSMKGLLVDRNTVENGLEIAMHIALSQLPRTDFTARLTSSNPALLPVPGTVSIGANLLARTLYLRAGVASQPTNVILTLQAGQVIRRVKVMVTP